MIRRLATACVLMGMLAAQWAVVPHSHGSSTDPSHDDSPHVHLTFTEREHSHSHHEGHAHCHCAATPADHAAPVGPVVDDADQHDADAVYLAGGDSPSAPVSVLKCPDQSPAAQAFALVTEVCDAVDCLTATVEAAATPFVSRAPSCARFLALRTLRI